MTPIDRFERQLPDELSYLAAERMPDYLDDLFAQTARTRQRPAWTFPERWLPMTITLRRPLLAPPMRLLAVGLALLLALLGAMALAPILSSSRPLPAMIATTWTNGLVAFAKDEDIWVGDPSPGGEARVLIGGDQVDDVPDWSPDGTHIAFLRNLDPAGQALMVANADGTDVRSVTTDPVVEWQWYAWSPDGSQLAVASRVNGQLSISIVAADGSGTQVLDLGFPADYATWRPDGEALLVRGASGGKRGLYVVSWPDGAVSEPIIATDTTTPYYVAWKDEYDFRYPMYSADGSMITYMTGMDNAGASQPDPGFRNHVMKADGTDDRLVEADPASDYEVRGSFSPDGTRLVMGLWGGDLNQIAIVTLDGSHPTVLTDPGASTGGAGFWSPDGTQVFGWADPNGILIDPDTGAVTTLPWTGGGFLDWQPIAP